MNRNRSKVKIYRLHTHLKLPLPLQIKIKIRSPGFELARTLSRIRSTSRNYLHPTQTAISNLPIVQCNGSSQPQFRKLMVSLEPFKALHYKQHPRVRVDLQCFRPYYKLRPLRKKEKKNHSSPPWLTLDVRNMVMHSPILISITTKESKFICKSSELKPIWLGCLIWSPSFWPIIPHT